MSNIAGLILAAGASRRMGQSKQALQIDGEPLLTVTSKKLIASEVDQVLLVLGSDYQTHEPLVKNLKLQTIYFPEWHIGMGGSLKFGIKHLTKQGSPPEAILVSVCDQPYLSITHINTLISTFRSKPHKIIASSYGETTGVPAIFSEEVYPDLLKMENESGAKKLIRSFGKAVSSVPMPLGEIDLDTPEDYQKYKKAAER